MTARVLVVDDIPTNVRLLEARLTAEYFDVLTASSGQEALDICAANPVDIVLLDVNEFRGNRSLQLMIDYIETD